MSKLFVSGSTFGRSTLRLSGFVGCYVQCFNESAQEKRIIEEERKAKQQALEAEKREKAWIL